MEIVKDFLNKFSDIVIPYHQHMVIGGIYALKLHGLETRGTADLDMVVYNPSESFIDMLLKDVQEETGDYPMNPEGSPRRSFKLTRDGLTIDFLIEYGVEKPDGLLMLVWSDRLWPVQSIKVVIEAKRKYGRDKDFTDFAQFALDNFGI